MAQDQYDCEFNICPNDSLQILVKDRRSKRKFSNLFTKLKLESMDIDQSITDLSSFLETSRDAKQNNLKNWKFLIKYKSISLLEERNELTAKNTLFSYKKGDKMVILINVTEPQFCMKASFKLNEIITNNTKKTALTLSQSTTHNPSDDRCSFNDIPRSPRRSLHVMDNNNTTRSRTKSPRRRSQSNAARKTKTRRKSDRKSLTPTNSVPKISIPSTDSVLQRKSITPIEQHNDKTEELEQWIESLKGENQMLLNKLQDVERKSPQTKRKKPDAEQKENRIWVKQKIERMQKSIENKILKEYNIHFKSNDEWKDIVNLSFNVIVKLAKTIHSKDEQYESVSNKWMKSKKENKELKKGQDLKDAMIEKQKNTINQLKQQIMDKEKSLNLRKQNERSLEDKMKKMEKEFVTKQDVYDKQIEDMNEERVRLNVRLNNSIQEMKENKTDFDELQQDKDQMVKDLKRLKFVINETNEKSLQLIECVKSSKEFVDALSTEKGETDDAEDIVTVSVSNSNNYV